MLANGYPLRHMDKPLRHIVAWTATMWDILSKVGYTLLQGDLLALEESAAKSSLVTVPCLMPTISLAFPFVASLFVTTLWH